MEENIKEVNKCLLVCSNCHREIHEGIIDISNITPRQVIVPPKTNKTEKEEPSVNDSKYNMEEDDDNLSS